MRPVRINATTDTNGDATEYGDVVTGTLYAVQEIDGDFADGVDITLTVEHADLSIPLLTHANFNSDGMIYPRVATKDIADGITTIGDTMPLVFGRPKLVVASGGAVKTGGVVLYILDI